MSDCSELTSDEGSRPNDDEKVEAPTKATRRRTIPFFKKLKKLFDDEPLMIQWIDGNIIIPNPRALEAKLKYYFRSSRWTSFQRQLNNFGYTKADRSSGQTHSVYVKTTGPPVRTLEELCKLHDKCGAMDDLSKSSTTVQDNAPRDCEAIDSLLTLHRGVTSTQTTQLFSPEECSSKKQLKRERTSDVKLESAPRRRRLSDRKVINPNPTLPSYRINNPYIAQQQIHQQMQSMMMQSPMMMECPPMQGNNAAYVPTINGPVLVSLNPWYYQQSHDLYPWMQMPMPQAY